MHDPKNGKQNTTLQPNGNSSANSNALPKAWKTPLYDTMVTTLRIAMYDSKHGKHHSTSISQRKLGRPQMGARPGVVGSLSTPTKTRNVKLCFNYVTIALITHVTTGAPSVSYILLPTIQAM